MGKSLYYYRIHSEEELKKFYECRKNHYNPVFQEKENKFFYEPDEYELLFECNQQEIGDYHIEMDLMERFHTTETLRKLIEEELVNESPNYIAISNLAKLAYASEGIYGLFVVCI